MLTYADVCSRVLTCADVCRKAVLLPAASVLIRVLDTQRGATSAGLAQPRAAAVLHLLFLLVQKYDS